MALHVYLRRGGVFSSDQASVWDLTRDSLRENVLKSRAEGRDLWVQGVAFPWQETKVQVFEGPSTSEIPDFTEALGPALYAMAGLLREVTGEYITGPPGGRAEPVPSLPTPSASGEVRYQVFLSSTFLDLEVERLEVTQELLRMGRCIPAGMELFGASSLPPWEFITQVLDVTDYLVLVLGTRYGSVAPGGGPSYTEREYDYAVSRGIPVLAFTPAATRLVKPEHVEWEPERVAALRAFHDKVQAAHLVTDWADAGELARKVATALWRAFSITPRPGWVRGTPTEATGSAAFDSVQAGATEGRQHAALGALNALAALDAATPHMDYRFAFNGSQVPDYVRQRRERAERALAELRRAEVANVSLLGVDLQRRWAELRKLANKATRTGEIGSAESKAAQVALAQHASDTHAAVLDILARAPSADPLAR